MLSRKIFYFDAISDLSYFPFYLLLDWMVNMYPLHVLAIIYEACSQLKPRFGNLLILRTICLSWILPGVGSMYSLLGTTFSARISV